MNAVAENTTLKLLRCQLGQRAIAVESSSVHSVHRGDTVQPWPHRSDVAGRVNVEGRAVTVYRPDALLGFPTTLPTSQMSAVVLRSDRGFWGLLVDRVSQMLVSADRRFPLPSQSAANGRFDAMIQANDEMLALLAPGQYGTEPAPRATRPSPAVSRKRPAGAHKRRVAQQRILIFSTGVTPVGSRPIVFGASITQVAEILETPTLLHLPGAHEHLEGVVNWRERAVEVVDLAAALGLRRDRGVARNRLLVLRAPGTTQPVGVQVCQSIEMLRLPTPHVESARDLPVDRTRIMRIVELRQATLIVPNLTALLS